MKTKKLNFNSGFILKDRCENKKLIFKKKKKIRQVKDKF